MSFGLASAGTIYSETGAPNPIFSYLVGGSGIDQMMVSSWTQIGSYTNVSITALVGSGTPMTVYLMSQVGPGTTVASQVATATINPPSGQETDTLFTGLTLGSGTYYLIMAAPGSVSAGAWWGTDTSTITTDTGVTGNPDTFVSDQSGSPNDVYPPASAFGLSGTHLIFTVSGDAGVSTTPEPSSFILVGLAGAFLFAAKSRLRR